MENFIGILIGIVLNLQSTFGSIVILTILILPIHDYIYILPSVCVVFNFFHQFLIVSHIQVFYLLG